MHQVHFYGQVPLAGSQLAAKLHHIVDTPSSQKIRYISTCSNYRDYCLPSIHYVCVLFPEYDMLVNWVHCVQKKKTVHYTADHITMYNNDLGTG